LSHQKNLENESVFDIDINQICLLSSKYSY